MGNKIEGSFSNEELIEVAEKQKNIIWMVLVSFAALLITLFIPYIMILTGLIQIYFIYKLAVATKSSAAWLYIILMFIPCISLLALLHINGIATKILQNNGIKVGIMGARKSDLERLRTSSSPNL